MIKNLLNFQKNKTFKNKISDKNIYQNVLFKKILLLIIFWKIYLNKLKILKILKKDLINLKKKNFLQNSYRIKKENHHRYKKKILINFNLIKYNYQRI